MRSSSFRVFWHRLFPSLWILGILLILLFGIPRFILVMQSNVTGQSQWVAMVFTCMMFTPLLFFQRQGRRELWRLKAARPIGLVAGFFLGGACAIFLFLVFRLLYGPEIQNAFQYIGSKTTSGSRDPVYMIIYLAVSMTFSPIGEELFYRGVIHESFRESFGERHASVIDSLAFSLTHLAHFGLIHHQDKWQVYWIPAMIWVSGMFLLCLIFNYMRRTTGSVLGAILTHAGFNCAMGIILLHLPYG